jgi:hypothetical protein
MNPICAISAPKQGTPRRSLVDLLIKREFECRSVELPRRFPAMKTARSETSSDRTLFVSEKYQHRSECLAFAV